MQIEEKPPFDTPFEWIGGEARVQLLVDRFYDLMDLEPGYLELRQAHGPELANARELMDADHRADQQQILLGLDAEGPGRAGGDGGGVDGGRG